MHNLCIHYRLLRNGLKIIYFASFSITLNKNTFS